MLTAPPSRLLTLIVLASVVLMAKTGYTAGAKAVPAPAHRTLAAEGRMRLSDTDRCPVCAMYPARRPDTAAAMTLESGETYYFCGNGCLLRAWLRPAVYLGTSRDRIARIVVLDYFSGSPVDGRTATWVAGSDVVGPMGPAIVTLGEDRHLETFKKRHGGTAVFAFENVDDDLWKRIGRRELPPQEDQ